VVAVESEIAVEEACDVNPPFPCYSGAPRHRCAHTGGAVFPASSCSPKAPRASPSSPPATIPRSRPTRKRRQKRRSILACSTCALPTFAYRTSQIDNSPRARVLATPCYPQFADVNAFLTFAATQHTYTPEHLQGRPRVAQILEAAKAGHVPVRLVSSTSFPTSPTHPSIRPSLLAGWRS
jgi:hypothetical protein